MKQDYYFLFGEQAVFIYEETKDIKKIVDEADYELFHYNTVRNTPGELLLYYELWLGYIEITEDEYKQIRELQQNQ